MNKQAGENVEKNMPLSYARGIAIILVVIGHAIEYLHLGSSNGGLFLMETRKWIYLFHMPLFFFMSGFFAKEVKFTDSDKTIVTFIKDKAMKLLIPYFSMTTLIIIIRLVLGYFDKSQAIQVGQAILNAFFVPTNNPMAPLWFLYVVFVASVTVPFFKGKSLYVFLISLLIMRALNLPLTDILAIKRIVINVPFYVLGMILSKHYSFFLKIPYKATISVMLFILLSVIKVGFVSFVWPRWTDGIMKITAAFIGVFAVLFMVHVLKPYSGKLFEKIGEYSLDIYLFSYIAQQITALFMAKAQFKNTIAELFILIAVGFLPILISKYIIRKSKVLSFLFIGRTIRNM